MHLCRAFDFEATISRGRSQSYTKSFPGCGTLCIICSFTTIFLNCLYIFLHFYYQQFSYIFLILLCLKTNNVNSAAWSTWQDIQGPRYFVLFYFLRPFVFFYILHGASLHSIYHIRPSYTRKVANTCKPSTLATRPSTYSRA